MPEEDKSLEQRAVALARGEILSPTLSATKEMLAVHTPVLVDGQPVIARADVAREPGAFYFYFRLEHEPYYLVVVVQANNRQLAVECACVEAAVRVFLLVKAKHLTPQQISERLGLESTSAYAKGERIHPALPPLPYTKWRFEPHQTLAEELGRKLDLLLDELEGAAPRIAELAAECDVSISVCYEGCKEWLGGWNASKETLKRLAALGADLHFDLYASGPDLPDLDFPDPQEK
jgi:transcriptional regulator with XRE-family HTH domain